MKKKIVLTVLLVAALGILAAKTSKRNCKIGLFIEKRESIALSVVPVNSGFSAGNYMLNVDNTSDYSLQININAYNSLLNGASYNNIGLLMKDITTSRYFSLNTAENPSVNNVYITAVVTD